MGLFDRFRSAGQVVADSSASKANTSEQDALRLIEQGHALEAEGRLDEAMQCYLNAIRLAPNPARAHLNRGNILLLKGDLPAALDAFRTAIQYKPDYAGAYYNIGNALLGNKQLDEAVASYRQALKIEPDYAEVHCSLGVALKELGQLDSAIESFQRALQINPDLVEAHTNLGNVAQELYSRGNVLLDNGKLDDAVATFHSALGINPDFVEAHYNRGVALQELGRSEDAAASYRQALKIRPDYAEAHFNLGNILKSLGQLDGAIDSFQHALQIKPDYAEAHYNLGNTLQGIGQLDNAVASYLRALEIKPDCAEAHSNLGNAKLHLGQLESAVESYRSALQINPNLAETHLNMGNALKGLGQFDSAEASFRHALEIKPNFAEAHWNLASLLLSQGRYAEAWPEFEARYDPSYLGRRSFPPILPFPQWRGESLTGKSIVIWPEQGFGDKIQFARYFPLLKMRGVTRLTLVCTPPLIALFENIAGVDAVILFSDAASLPFHDYWAFSMSLPLLFSTTVETIPTMLPYLSAPSDRLKRWRNRLPTSGLKVGLVWKGSALPNPHRSLPGLSTLAPLWSVPGVTFVSLQKGLGEEEAATPPVGQPILDLGPDIMDFADSAAIVAQLDLVICIDTVIAHLTGALNKPCWVILPAIGVDWRWFHERTDSPWYPVVMRLFRQTKAGDWAAPINDAAQALKTWVDERTHAT